MKQLEQWQFQWKDEATGKQKVEMRSIKRMTGERRNKSPRKPSSLDRFAGGSSGAGEGAGRFRAGAGFGFAAGA